jgi:hypothetical protein
MSDGRQTWRLAPTIRWVSSLAFLSSAIVSFPLLRTGDRDLPFEDLATTTIIMT